MPASVAGRGQSWFGSADRMVLGHDQVMDSSRWMAAVDVAEQVRSGERQASEVVDEAIVRIEAENPALACVVIPLFERARPSR